MGATYSDILLLKGMDRATKMRVSRAANHLRQVDVAVLATQELERRGFGWLKVGPHHVSDMESGFSIDRRRMAAILAVLDLHESTPAGCDESD